MCDNDKIMQLMHIKSHTGVGLQALKEALPVYTDKDFLLVHRKSDKGIWKEEVWTKRDFAPYEIQFGPFSSQIKDSHIMSSANAVLSLPKHGIGAHPDNQSLALDGRGKTQMAAAKVLDASVHEGSFFWTVTRTSNPKAVNLTCEVVQQEATVVLSIPAPKRRRTQTVHWDPANLPGIPIMCNPKYIKKHEPLAVFYEPNKKESSKQPE